MAAALPSLQRRFLRIFISIAAVMTLLMAIGLSTDDYLYQRRAQIENMQQVANAAAHLFLIANGSQHQSSQMTDYLSSFETNTRLVRLCAYNDADQLIASWQRLSENGECPKLMTKSGVETDAFFVRIALPIEHSGKYSGMIYAQGDLFTLTQWLFCVSKVLVTLFAMAAAAAWLAARLSANSIVAPLLALRRQIDCLKNNDIVSCAIPFEALTQETASLSSNIASLRSYFEETNVPKETLLQMRNWYWEVLSELLAMLRQRIRADSPLIENLNDYALLLQTIRGDLLPPPRPFDLTHTINLAVAGARLSHPPDAQVTLSASLSPEMQTTWCGQPEMLEALLRHLLLIGLKRTHSGFVSLKLETYVQHHLTARYRLRISLQDSGPLIQHWQLQQWLAFSVEGTPPEGMNGDISWLLASRLFKRLEGSLIDASNKEIGLSLEGNVPLMAYTPEFSTPAPVAIATPHTIAPLVLVIENDKENLNAIESLFTMAGYRAFIIHSHKQALEWAPTLPFCAIILNAPMADATPDIARRLRYMMQNGAMPQVPLWASTAKFSFIDFDYWRVQGVSELLLKPYEVQELKRLAAGLPAHNAEFYLAHNQLLHEDMANTSISLPKAIKMLADQVMLVEPVLEALVSGPLPEDARQAPHSVKSAALTLGYFHLAALMGQIEHAIVSPDRNFSARNWAIILEVLKSAGF